MENEAHIGFLHLIATGGGGMLATVALVWRMWIAPAHKKEVDLQVRLSQLEGRIEQTEKDLEKGSDNFETINKQLQDINKTLTRLETVISHSVWRGVNGKEAD